MSRETVLVVSPYRTEYGPREVFEHVCRALVDAGLRPVRVVSAGARATPVLADLAPDIYEIDGLETIPRTYNPYRLASFMRAHTLTARRLADIARAERAAAIYSTSEALLSPSLAARRLGIGGIVHAIGMSIARPRWSGVPYVRLLAAVSDHFVACSAAVAQMLADYGVPEDRLSVAHNGIDVRRVASLGEGPSPIDHPGPRVGLVAAYDPRKGHELFVEAAAWVAESHPDARFYIIGGALEGLRESIAFERQIARLIAELGLDPVFVRPGYVPTPDVYRWIRALDVVVVPSRTEAFAHALLEAMALGTAVVATHVEGNLDAFVDRHSGIYVAPNPRHVAAAIHELLDDPARAAAIGAAAAERVALLFDLSATLPPITHAVEATIAQRRTV